MRHANRGDDFARERDRRYVIDAEQLGKLIEIEGELPRSLQTIILRGEQSLDILRKFGGRTVVPVEDRLVLGVVLVSRVRQVEHFHRLPAEAVHDLHIDGGLGSRKPDPLLGDIHDDGRLGE